MITKQKILLISTANIICILSALSMMAFTCQKRTDSPVIARVGGSVLTQDDLLARIPAEYNDRISREQKINYVKLWIDTELLYQDALRKKVHNEPEIRSRLRQMKKDLLCAEMISRISVSSGNNPISEDAIRDYYNLHKNEFIRNADVIKYLEIVCEDQKSSWGVHKLVTEDNFLDLAVKYSKSPVQDPRTISYVPVTALPKNVAAVIPAIKINGTTAPVEVDGSWHIIRILDKQLAGTFCSVDEVREEIISTLSTGAQKKHMENLLSELRLKTDYELIFENIPADAGDTAQIPPG